MKLDFRKSSAYRAKVDAREDLITRAELLKRLRNDEITIDLRGHNRNHKDYVDETKKEIIRRLEGREETCQEISNLEQKIAAGEEIKKYDGTVNENPEDTLKFLRLELDIFETDKMKSGTELIGFGSGRTDCFNCGKELPWILLDENTISLGPDYSMIDDDLTDLSDCDCSYPDGTPAHVTEVNMETGELVFANFFDDRKSNPKGENERPIEIFDPENKYSHEWSINHYRGRTKYANHYAEKFNILYGQMGNMSVAVWANKDNSKIYIVHPYFDDGGYDYNKAHQSELKKILNDGKFTERGKISLSMWRWMAADKSTLDKYEIPVIDTTKKAYKSTHYCDQDFVVIKGEPGKWVCQHFYDSDDHPNEHIYSIIEKV